MFVAAKTSPNHATRENKSTEASRAKETRSHRSHRDEVINQILADAGESRDSVAEKKSFSAAAASLAQSDVMRDNTGAALAQRLANLRSLDELISSLVRQKLSLEQQIAALDRDVASATMQRDMLRVECANVTSHHNDKMSRYAAAKEQADRAEALESAVNSICSSFEALEACVADQERMISGAVESPHSSAAPQQLTPAELLVQTSQRKDINIRSFESYAGAEAACIEALAGRVAAIKAKIAKKAQEITEYKRMGIPVSYFYNCIVFVLVNQKFCCATSSLC